MRLTSLINRCVERNPSRAMKGRDLANLFTG
jgi:hypothetical protein